MKPQLASFLLIILGLFELAAGAKAETHGHVIVKVPYEFVVAGCTLPAGTYTVSRLSDDPPTGLTIASRELRSGVLLLANHFANRPADDTKVLCERIGDTYLPQLDRIAGWCVHLVVASLRSPDGEITSYRWHDRFRDTLMLSAHSPYLVASHSWLRLATSTERVFERWPIGDRGAAEIAVRA